MTNELTTYTLYRTGLPDLRFKGRLLASVINDAPGKGHWLERLVYLTEGGKLVYHKVRCSRQQGGENRALVQVHDNELSLAKALREERDKLAFALCNAMGIEYVEYLE